MKEILQILGCGIVYFLVVYLFVIRRETLPIVPWAICITAQVSCAVCFDSIKHFFQTLLPEERFGSLGMVIPSAILCVGNTLLIVIMFGGVLGGAEKKKEAAAAASTNKEFRIAPLPSVMNSDKNDAASDTDESGITIDYIKKMIADGRNEEAVKYLKMLAYYGSDDKLRDEARTLLDELSSAGE